MKPTPSSSRLRSDLFYKLGINRRPESTRSIEHENFRGSVLGRVQIRSEPLKYDRVIPQKPGTSLSNLISFGGLFGGASSKITDSSVVSSESMDNFTSVESSKSKDSRQKDKRTLSFNDVVTVALIPKKEEYSNRIRDHLWNSSKELEENAYRNTIEFLAEGWDWRKVTEDEYMYIDATSGEMIHPVHIETSEA